MEVLATIFASLGGIASSILSIATCITLFAKPIRNRFVQWIKNIAFAETKEQIDLLLLQLNERIELIMNQINAQQGGNDLQTEALKSLLRNSITHIYYKNENSATLREYEAQILLAHCDIYFRMGGNGFIKQIYEIMKTWKVIP